MNVKRTKYLILGAGPMGLGAAYKLKELGLNDFLVLEKSDHPGGLASSYTDDKGFVWDVGGHVHFSHYAYYDRAVDRVLGPDGFYKHVRNTHVWVKDRFVPYPFQNNLHYLPLGSRLACLAGLVTAGVSNPETPPSNFYEWAYHTFGSGIMSEFFEPYNRKVWAYPLEKLDIGWMGERVATVKVASVVKNTLLKIDQKTWGPNNTFRFPKAGGSGVIWTAMAKFIGTDHLRLHSEAVRIDPVQKTVQLQSGEIVGYEYLITSIPLPKLMEIMDDLTSAARAAASQLLYSSSHVVGVGLQGKPPAFIADKSWMYFPESDIPYYRATVLSNYSPACVPDSSQMWSLLLEMSESSEINTGFTKAVEKTISALLRTKFIASEKDILSTWYFKATFGYPTPQLGRDKILLEIQPELENLGIFSRGRFGGWKYEASNQDHTFMQGVEVVDRLENGIREVTYPTPDIANRGIR